MGSLKNNSLKNNMNIRKFFNLQTPDESQLIQSQHVKFIEKALELSEKYNESWQKGVNDYNNICKNAKCKSTNIVEKILGYNRWNEIQTCRHCSDCGTDFETMEMHNRSVSWYFQNWMKTLRIHVNANRDIKDFDVFDECYAETIARFHIYCDNEDVLSLKKLRKYYTSIFDK